jgi:hypothetical protein
MAGDFGHQEVAERVKILRLLFGCGEAPEGQDRSEAMSLTSTVASITCCNLRRFSGNKSGLLTIATNHSAVLLTKLTACCADCAQARPVVRAVARTPIAGIKAMTDRRGCIVWSPRKRSLQAGRRFMKQNALSGTK